MPSNDTRHDGALSRRQYVQALFAAGVVGLAGCDGGGGGTATPTPTDTDTPTPTDSEGPTPTPGEGPTPTDTTTEASLGEPVNDTITAMENAVPETYNQFPWAESTNAGLELWTEETTWALNVVNRDRYFNGDEIEASYAPGRDTLEMVAILENVEYEPPYDAYFTMNPELTFWDGTPIDAQTRHDYTFLNFATGGGLTDSTATHNVEVASDFEVHEWYNKGNVEGQTANPTPLRVMQSLPGIIWAQNNTPYHPDLQEPWVERYKSASTDDEVTSVTENIRGQTLSLREMADNDYGSGSYRIPSSDAISQDRVNMELRDDHPASDQVTIPNLEIALASQDREDVLMQQGVPDIVPGFISEQDRSSVGDSIKEVDHYPSLHVDYLIFNGNNPHIARLWVRRAMIAATDLIQMMENGWGNSGSIPVKWHNGTNNPTARRWFSQDFLNSLYKYPMQSDMELASTWMENAGYTKVGDTWTGPDGNTPSINFLWSASIPGWEPAIQTVADNLRELGIQVNIDGVPNTTYYDRLDADNLNFDLAMKWGQSTAVPWDFYASSGAWWNDPLVDGDPDDAGNTLESDDAYDAEKMPTICEIPTEVGSIEAPKPAGNPPSLSDAGIDAEQINVPNLIKDMTAVDISEEQFQESLRKMARWYNYYMPCMLFHQVASGVSGDTGQFTFPPRGHTLNRTWQSWVGEHLMVRTGAVQGKFEE